MLNPVTKNRELAYVVSIDAIEPIVGSDNCEAAVVGGWRVMVRKGTFKAGDLAVYFEIDSKVPETETYAFLAKKHYKVKTQRYTFGGKGLMISQGLLMHPTDFGWELQADGSIWNPNAGDHGRYEKGTFLTEELGVTYAVAEDNKRKGSVDKYKKMAQRRPNIFKKPWAKWMMRRAWGRKVMFFLFGRKKDTRTWPAWIVKTDEERIQNQPWRFSEENKGTVFIATEKIDGTSATYSLKKKKFGKPDFYVCSRNVVQDTPEKECFYDSNVYWEMVKQYDLETKMRRMFDLFSMDNPDFDFLTIQGEIYGEGIQKRDYNLIGHRLAVFNVIIGFNDGSTQRLNPITMTQFLYDHYLPGVPVVDEHFVLPNTCDELLAIATDKSKIDGGMREGLVFRSLDGKDSFKAVSNEFLLKYHS